VKVARIVSLGAPRSLLGAPRFFCNAFQCLLHHHSSTKREVGMRNRSHLVRRSLAVLICPTLLWASGCSTDDGLGQRYQVSGTVNYKGAPLAKGQITFSPVSGSGQGANGKIEDGSFSLSTLSPGDGVLPGEYKVSIDTREADEGKMQAEADKVFAKKGKGMEKLSMIPQEITAKYRKEAKSLIPERYMNPATSNLTAKVDPNSLSFTFDLTD
jgi:hypothetical protein